MAHPNLKYDTPDLYRAALLLEGSPYNFRAPNKEFERELPEWKNSLASLKHISVAIKEAGLKDPCLGRWIVKLASNPEQFRGEYLVQREFDIPSWIFSIGGDAKDAYSWMKRGQRFIPYLAGQMAKSVAPPDNIDLLREKAREYEKP
ncbi:MAG: hypothetical protein HY716_04030 [Planctomycetes bacterium]|nr:hypothetical protein [Planctomycetota bacterium]